MQSLKSSRASRPVTVSRGRLTVTAAAIPSMKLWYFDMPGRAEAARIMLKMSKGPWEDCRFKREEWPELKPKFPLGQVPVLEVDGKQLAQTAAINRYVAQIAGLYPADPWDAAQVDAMASFMQELPETLLGVRGRKNVGVLAANPHRTISIKDQAEKIAARKKLAEEGGLATRLKKLDDILAAAGPSGFLCGTSITMADIVAFQTLCLLVSGFFEGIPMNLYDKYPNVAAFRKRIANLPEIKAFYEEESNSDALRNCFRVA